MITKYGATWRETHLAHRARSLPGAHLAHRPPGNQELPGHLAHLAGSPPGVKYAHLAIAPPGASTWRKSHLAHLATWRPYKGQSHVGTQEKLLCVHRRISCEYTGEYTHAEHGGYGGYGIWNREHGSWSLEHGVCRAGYGIEGSEYGLWTMELH